MKKKLAILILLLSGMIVNSSIICYAQEIYSDWTDQKPDGVNDVQTKTQFRYRSKEFTNQVSTEKEKEVENWICYKSEKQIGEYGEWSQWSTNSVSATESVAVEQRSITDVPGYFWNVYHYYHWRDSSGHHYSPNYVAGSTYYKFEQKSTDSPQMYYDAGYGGYRLNNNNWGYGCNFDSEVWFRDSSTWNHPITHNEYRYRERPITYLNYYYRWSEWSSWIDNQVPVFDDNRENEFRVMYRYRIANSDNDISKSSQVEEKTQSTKQSVTGKTDSSIASKIGSQKKTDKIKVGSSFTKKPLVYRVISVSGRKGKLKVVSLTSTKLKKLIIPQKVKMKGVDFDVTVIGKNVFNKKCKKLKLIDIKTKSLTKFGKNRFAKKCKIIVPQAMKKKYIKLLAKCRRN